ncbi:Isopenicillin N epimerase [Hordeum vulgare]|nr:Isopenicillin N epimerase [Hordeum vulgare]
MVMVRHLRGEAHPLVVDMEAPHRDIKGFLVVGHLLLPFQVNPRFIIDELTSSAWKLQGEVIVQEVSSVDRRFILNFAVKADQCFVLKEQPWHLKRDDIILAEFYGKGNPTRLDLGVMAIWAQVSQEEEYGLDTWKSIKDGEG